VVQVSVDNVAPASADSAVQVSDKNVAAKPELFTPANCFSR